MYKVVKEGFTVVGACSEEPARRVIVPKGLQEIMSDIAKKVLEMQPKDSDMVQFIADFLEAKVTARSKVDEAHKIVEETICKVQNTMLMDFRKYGLHEDVANAAATKIQAAYKGYRVRKKFKDVIKKAKQMKDVPNLQSSQYIASVDDSVKLVEKQSAVILYKKSESIGQTATIYLESEFKSAMNEDEETMLPEMSCETVPCIDHDHVDDNYFKVVQLDSDVQEELLEEFRREQIREQDVYVLQSERKSKKSLLETPAERLSKTVDSEISHTAETREISKSEKDGKIYIIKREGFCEIAKIDQTSKICKGHISQPTVLIDVLKQMKTGQISRDLLAELIESGQISKEVAEILASGEKTQILKIISEIMKEQKLKESKLSGSYKPDDKRAFASRDLTTQKSSKESKKPKPNQFYEDLKSGRFNIVKHDRFCEALKYSEIDVEEQSPVPTEIVKHYVPKKRICDKPKPKQVSLQGKQPTFNAENQLSSISTKIDTGDQMLVDNQLLSSKDKLLSDSKLMEEKLLSEHDQLEAPKTPYKSDVTPDNTFLQDETILQGSEEKIYETGEVSHSEMGEMSHSEMGEMSHSEMGEMSQSKINSISSAKSVSSSSKSKADGKYSPQKDGTEEISDSAIDDELDQTKKQHRCIERYAPEMKTDEPKRDDTPRTEKKVSDVVLLKPICISKSIQELQKRAENTCKYLKDHGDPKKKECTCNEISQLICKHISEYKSASHRSRRLHEIKKKQEADQFSHERLGKRKASEISQKEEVSSRVGDCVSQDSRRQDFQIRPCDENKHKESFVGKTEN